MANNLDTRLTIDVETQGESQVSALRADVEGIGKASDDASPKLTPLAEAIQDIGKPKEDIQEVAGSIGSVGKASRAVHPELLRLGVLAGAAVAAMAAKKILQISREFDHLKKSLTGATGSAENAAREMDYLLRTSSRLGLELVSTGEAYAKLAAATRGTQLEGEQTRRVFEAVAGSMLAAGKSSAEVEKAIEQLATKIGKGSSATGELLRQLDDQLPGAFKAAADSIGATEEELQKMIRSGQVLAEDILPSLAAELTKTYDAGGDISGLEASWNRFKNSVSELADTSGLLSSVTAVTEGVKSFFAAAADIGTWSAQAFTAAAGDIAAGVKTIGTTVGGVAGAILSGNWSELPGFFSEKALEIADAQDKTRQGFYGTGEAAEKAADQVRSAAEQALAGNGGWLAVSVTVDKVRASLADLTSLMIKTAEATKAEGEAAVAYAKSLGDVVAVREAEAAAAQKNAEAAENVAKAREAELNAARNEIAVKEQAAAATEQESKAKQQLIDQLKTQIPLMEEEVNKSRALADQLKIEAKTRELAAIAAKDHSASLVELRDAYQQEIEHVQMLTEAEQLGLDVANDLAAARERLAMAAFLYRDAISDSVELVKAENAEKQAGLTIDVRNAELRLAEIRNRESLYKSLGNETLARQEAIKAKNVEIEIAQLRVDQINAEAEGMIRQIELEREQAEANGTLTEAKKLEFETRLKTAEAKKIEAQISEKNVDLLKQERQEIERNRGAAEEAGDAGEEAAERTGVAVGAATDKVKALGAAWLEGVDAASSYASEAVKMVYEQIQAGDLAIDAAQQAATKIVQSLEDLDRQQEAITNNSADALDDLRLRLLEVNGTEEQIAAARQSRERAEVERSVALLQLDMQRAKLRGDAEELKRLQQEINLLREQLSLIDQIYAAEAKKRQDDERDSAGGNGGSSGGSGSSSGGSSIDAVSRNSTVNITVVGDTDPANTARRVKELIDRQNKLAS